MRIRLSIVGGLVLLMLLIAAFSTPTDFVEGTIVSIPQGTSFLKVAGILEQEHVVTASVSLRVFTTLFGGTKAVQAGDYLFSQPEGSARVAWRLTHGDYGLERVRVVLPEGLTVTQMGERIQKQLPHFDVVKFEQLASGKEGYLFPDTYFFMGNVSPEGVIDTLSKRFDEVTAELLDEITTSGHTFADIVTMASIIEEEAQTPEDKRIVSGVLWKRIDIGMALQVDATFKYTLNKASHELTTEDLETDSPYNTYTRAGLPPTPISNPGEDSLRAALEPTETEYLYYLTGNDGAMHYAKTFEEHKQNKELYLR